MGVWGKNRIISIFLVLVFLISMTGMAFAGVPVAGTEISYDDHGATDGYTKLGGGDFGDYTKQTLISITPSHDGKLKSLGLIYKTNGSGSRNAKLLFLDSSKNTILNETITFPRSNSDSFYLANYSTPQEITAGTEYYVGLERIIGYQISIGADTSSPDSKSVSQKCLIGACLMPWYTTETSKDHMIRAYVNYYPTVANAAVNRTPTNDNPVTITADCTDYDTSSYIASADYRIDGGSWNSMTASDGAFSSTTEQVTKYWDTTTFSDGNHIIEVRCMDADGEYTQTNSTTSVFLDYVDPETNISVGGTNGTDGWYVSTADVSLTPSDPDYPTAGSGIADTKYILSGATTQAETSGTSFTISAEGTTTIEYWSTDVAGNEEAHKISVVSIDTVKPTVPVIDDFENEFLNATQETISWSPASDDTSGVKMYTLVRRINGNHFTDSIDTNALSYLDNRGFVTDSLFEYKIKSIDYAGNESDWSDIKGFTVDLNAPTAPVMHALAAYTGGSGDVSLSWDASEDLSGINHYDIQEKWGILNFPNTDNHSTVADETNYLDNDNSLSGRTHKYKTKATDNSEPTPKESSWSGTVSTFVDLVEPNASAITLPNLSPNGLDNWYVTSTGVMIIATDPLVGSGIDYIAYCVYQGASDCSSFTNVSGNIAMVSLTEGENHVKYYAVDRAGNVSSTQTKDVKLDLSNPYNQTILLDGGNEYNNTRNVTATLNIGADDISGLDSCKIKWEDSSGWEDIDLAASASHTFSNDGEKTVRYRCYDVAGRKTNPVAFDTIVVDATPPVSYINKPTGAEAVLDGKVRVAGTAYDATSGINRVIVSVLDNSMNVVDTGIATGTENWIYFWDARNDIDAAYYTIKSVAVDNATNDEPDANVLIFKLDYSTPTIDNYYYAVSGTEYVSVSGYLDYQNIDYNIVIFNSANTTGIPDYTFPVITDDNGFFELTIDVTSWDQSSLYTAKVVGSEKSVSPTQFDGMYMTYQAETLSERIDLADSNIVNLWSTVNDLNDVDAELNSRIDAADLKIADLNSQIIVIKQQLIDMNEEIAEIQAHLSAIDANLNAVWTEIASIKATIYAMNHGTLYLAYDQDRVGGWLRAKGEAPTATVKVKIQVMNVDHDVIDTVFDNSIDPTNNQYLYDFSGVNSWSPQIYEIRATFINASNNTIGQVVNVQFYALAELMDFQGFGYKDSDRQTYFVVLPTSFPMNFEFGATESGQYDFNLVLTDGVTTTNQILTTNYMSKFDSQSYNNVRYSVPSKGNWLANLIAVNQSTGTITESDDFNIEVVDLYETIAGSIVIDYNAYYNDNMFSVQGSTFYTNADFELVTAINGVALDNRCHFYKLGYDRSLWDPQIISNVCKHMLFPDDRNILGTSEGLFVIRAESALTNVSSADFNLGLDYTNPVIESIVPYENIYSGIMHIDVSAFDSLSGIERIDIEIIDKNTGVVHRTYTDIEYNSVTGFFDIDVNTLEEDSEGNKYLPDGSYNIAGYAYDVAGNSSTLRVDPGVDNTKPILYASSIGLSYNPIIRGRLLHIDINASDNFSGVNNVTAKVYRESTTGNCESANPEASWAILSGGRYWAWASPCDGGCSVADPNKVEGWRYATEEEWANRPVQSEFLDIYGNVICAASQFDNTYSHCDYGNPEERIPTGSWHESWYIYDCTATTELVEMATIPLELTSGNVLEGIWSADYNVPSTWSTEGKYTIVFDANDTALNPNNAVDVNEETSVIKDYSFGVANQSGYSPKVFTIDGNFRDDEGNVPGVDANTILITSSVVGVTSVSFDENGSFRITTNNLRVGTYYIDLTYNTSDFNYTTRISLSVTNAPPLRGGGGSGAGRSAPEVVDENVPVEETGPTTPEEIEGGEETLEEPLVVEETPVVAAPEVVQPTGPTGLFGLGEAGNYIPLGLLALLVLGGLWFVLFKRK